LVLDEVADLLGIRGRPHCREVEEIAGHKLAVGVSGWRN